ncbi:hypothetical protein Xthr_19020 [Xanthomonas citri pv. thirumalacharii]|uniref:Uncharacterized protein n=1 Tax=Xanthomonas citri pv. sesbaniae TaxID=473425 RepID=A0AAW4RQR3_XANCI|nr:hypothetical protein [Xanthomonas citri pv. sesbaniae]MBZ3928447.1 hypothetical protein [Xanthomonas citri pv. thirumalacharii]
MGGCRDIDDLVARSYESSKLNDAEYRLVIPYTNDADLKEQLDGLLHEICHLADQRNYVVDDISIKNESNDLYWDECDGGWK